MLPDGAEQREVESLTAFENANQRGKRIVEPLDPRRRVQSRARFSERSRRLNGQNATPSSGMPRGIATSTRANVDDAARGFGQEMHHFGIEPCG